MPVGVEWTVDGKQSRSCGRMRHACTGGIREPRSEVSVPADAWPINANISSTVVGTRTDGKTIYVGETAGPPRIYQGLVHFTGRG